MVIHGHVQNGVVIPDGAVCLPDGTEVTIVVGSKNQSADRPMSASERQRYLEGLARIDATVNENPGDTFSGADHDRALYGEKS